MSETKHTPGPWRQPVQWDAWQGVDVPRGRVETGAGPGEGAIVVSVDGFPPEETLANCRLIAAAPDLLEALRGLLEFEEDGHGGGECGAGYRPGECMVCAAVDAANAAIAKATGGAA